eukprot:TRINITY_DN6137_c0_g1_i1.p1 TRINITY_DN6137_c0_g1~~TRINITY_DN6137_c0_g1_i1.p1  ORF type:complete len:384 (-),score=61.42 TRINITY_DN6137_c0_g1_i1:50-1129(-)
MAQATNSPTQDYGPTTHMIESEDSSNDYSDSDNEESEESEYDEDRFHLQYLVQEKDELLKEIDKTKYLYDDEIRETERIKLLLPIELRKESWWVDPEFMIGPSWMRYKVYKEILSVSEKPIMFDASLKGCDISGTSASKNIKKKKSKTTPPLTTKKKKKKKKSKNKKKQNALDNMPASLPKKKKKHTKIVVDGNSCKIDKLETWVSKDPSPHLVESFQTLADKWQNHCMTPVIMESAIVEDHLKTKAYAEIVKLGEPIVSLVMSNWLEEGRYSRMWWFFVLHEIVYNERYDYGIQFSVTEEKEKWKRWWFGELQKEEQIKIGSEHHIKGIKQECDGEKEVRAQKVEELRRCRLEKKVPK